MNTTQASTATQRLHALDNLRALMMWLGIVLHVGVIYMAGPSPLPWRDDARTRIADLLVAFIHAFRMPVFFILAGFFVALLLQSRGAAGMARHRLARLGLPFAVFWPPIFVATVTLALLFMHRMARGTWGVDPLLMPDDPSTPRGPNTMHMWFLWLLLAFSAVSAAVARWLRGPWLTACAKGLQRLAASWWGPLVLTLPLLAAGWAYPDGLLRPSGSFFTAWPDWLHNGMFFLVGLALYHQQWELFALFQRRCVAYGVAGIVLFLASGALHELHAPRGSFAYAYNLAAWPLSFAFIGGALRLLDRRSPVLGYLADSSYWVYLVHMPLTIAFGVLMYRTGLPAIAKIGIDIAATTAVCLASYHLFVRFTWVSVLLNGKRHIRHQPSSGVFRHA
jgi:peptidoglycan/LPS O-acetylase OafA/YrhL